jgi:hypothetical protein
MQLFWLAVFVAVLGWILMLYYNHRLTNIRADSLVTERYLENNGVAFEAISGSSPTPANWWHDWQELLVFTLIVLMSLVPTLAVWKFAN